MGYRRGGGSRVPAFVLLHKGLQVVHCQGLHFVAVVVILVLPLLWWPCFCFERPLWPFGCILV